MGKSGLKAKKAKDLHSTFLSRLLLKNNLFYNVQRDPRKLRDYWYHYEALAGAVQTNGIKPETLAAHHARPRRGVTMDTIESAVPFRALSDMSRVEITITAQRLQEVVKFSKKGLRTFPGTAK